MEKSLQPLWKAVLSGSIAFVFGLGSWQLTLLYLKLDLPFRWWSFGLGLFLIHVVFSWALIEFFHFAGFRSKWVYRGAFLGSVVWGFFWWFRHPYAFLLLIVIFLASFLGGLLATRQHIGIWEDNFPPPQEIRDAVYQKHQEIIDEPGGVPWAKRVFDVCLSLLGLILSTPAWLICVFLIWFEDPGPLFFVKNSVGKGGLNFHQFKLRTMVRGAEASTGPIMASEADTRALQVGRFLRKAALDELPQLFNILRGDMSFVGPRPQRTVLVNDYLNLMPEFAERHRVLPGLAGLAQVAGSYHITPRQKLRYDRIYARHASLGFDLKLIFLAFGLVFYLRWKPGGADRIPRNWLH